MKNIAVVYGGYSSEFEISISSGKNIAKSLDFSLYNVYHVCISKEKWVLLLNGNEYLIDKGDFSATVDGKHISFDKVYITIHGKPGENGIMQAYFELLEIPFTTCSSLVTSIAFDKYSCKSYLKDADVTMAKDVFIRKGLKYDKVSIVTKLGFPMFVKPNSGGSSYGITKVKKIEDLDGAILDAFKEDDTIIIEEAIKGRELTCGVYRKNASVYLLPLIEIVPKTEYFDYEAKYLGASAEICPAPVSKEIWSKVQNVSSHIYEYLGCRGLVRMDFIERDGELYFLEVNITPGMTDASLVPQMVKVDGQNFTDFLTSIIEEK